jgi:MOSC domain-containing protein YiiM
LSPEVVAVSSKSTHGVDKTNRAVIRLVAGEGVEGDAHFGATVKHRSRWRRDPLQANLRQVHLIHAELFDELAAKGFSVRPGLMGENVTTRRIDLLELSAGTVLRLGPGAVIQVTGLRNPCYQLDELQPGLMAACLDKRGKELVRKAGIMAVVLVGGDVRAGDAITVEAPVGPHEPLQAV